MKTNKCQLEELEGWVDFDVALFAIGRSLGILAGEYSEIQNAKIVLWSQNPIHDCLLNIAEELGRIGYLEYNKERRQYRVKSGFSIKDTTLDSGKLR